MAHAIDSPMTDWEGQGQAKDDKYSPRNPMPSTDSRYDSNYAKGVAPADDPDEPINKPVKTQTEYVPGGYKGYFYSKIEGDPSRVSSTQVKNDRTAADKAVNPRRRRR